MRRGAIGGRRGRHGDGLGPSVWKPMRLEHRARESTVRVCVQRRAAVDPLVATRAGIGCMLVEVGVLAVFIIVVLIIVVVVFEVDVGKGRKRTARLGNITLEATAPPTLEGGTFDVVLRGGGQTLCGRLGRCGGGVGGGVSAKIT